MAGQEVRLCQLLLHALGHVYRFGRRLDALKQDRELVSTETRHHVGVAYGILQAPRDGDQELVADGMAQTVIDVLEAVEIDKEYRELVPLLLSGALDGRP